MKDESNSYMRQLNLLTRQNPIRVFFTMFFAGFGIQDILFEFKAYMGLSLTVGVPPIYLKLFLGFVLSIGVLHSAYKKKININT